MRHPGTLRFPSVSKVRNGPLKEWSGRMLKCCADALATSAVVSIAVRMVAPGLKWPARSGQPEGMEVPRATAEPFANLAAARYAKQDCPR